MSDHRDSNFIGRLSAFSHLPKTLFLLLAFLASSTFSALSEAEVILTMGGDLNLNPSHEEPDPRGGCKHGRCYYWHEMFRELQPLLIGQLNFYNLETVVADEYSELRPHGGKYLFRTHPEGIRYARQIGLNWFSMANNHVGDYGPAGLLESLTQLERIADEPSRQPFFYHGVARSRDEILKPAVLELDTPHDGRIRIAFAAISYVRNTAVPVGEQRPGLIYPENQRDMNELLRNFQTTRADFKVLSIHGGKEKQLNLDSWQQRTYQRFLEKGDIDLIIGHHPHRVRPIERVGNKVIFYSLGNYLMLGAGALNNLDQYEDYGLLARLYLKKARNGRLQIRLMEAIPLFNMHAQVYPLRGDEGRERILRLNELSEEELGWSAVSWDILPQGWGRICLQDCRPTPQIPRTHLF